MSLDETLDIGEDTGTPISEDYKVPFAFTGSIAKVTIDLGAADAKVAAEVARQREIARTAE
jgi:arylsulfatase